MIEIPFLRLGDGQPASDMRIIISTDCVRSPGRVGVGSDNLSEEFKGIAVKAQPALSAADVAIVWAAVLSEMTARLGPRAVAPLNPHRVVPLARIEAAFPPRVEVAYTNSIPIDHDT